MYVDISSRRSIKVDIMTCSLRLLMDLIILSSRQVIQLMESLAIIQLTLHGGETKDWTRGF